MEFTARVEPPFPGYIHALGKGLSVTVPRDIFGRSCSKIEGRRDRKLHPMADQGTPMVASPGAICQRRIRNLNSDICINIYTYTYIHRTFFPRVCVLLRSFLSRTLSFSHYSFFCFPPLLLLFDLDVTVSREIGTSF